MLSQSDLSIPSDSVGDMTMPTDFTYRDVAAKGMPQHDSMDSFRVRHPRMAIGRRAKIFAPFDALRGFSAAVIAKDTQYVDPKELSEENREELNRRLSILYGLTYNQRVARANHIPVTVTYYVPCADPHSSSCGSQGQYLRLSGICYGIDLQVDKTIHVGDISLPLANVIYIESEGDIFEQE